ncbi:MAG: transcription termination/antitermination protein NusG [Phycisphaerales bacterium]
MLLVPSNFRESTISSAHQRKWCVLHVKSRQEKAVSEILHEAGVETFLPTSRKVRFYGHRKRVVDFALFPSYVFMRSTVEEGYFAISTRRVARIIPVCDQDRFEREVEMIRAAIDRSGVLAAAPYLTSGTRVRVITGPFMGIEGIVETRGNWDRISLQIQTLGRAASLEVDASMLEKVSD